MGRRRLLVCAFGFPPIGGPTEFRWLQFCRFLSEFGWDIDVVTVAELPRLGRYDPRLLEQLPSQIRVHRVFPGPVHHGRFYATTGLVAGLTAGTTAKRTWRWNLKAAISRLDSRLDILKIPDRTVEWVPFAVRRVNSLLQQRHFDILVTSSAPFSSHLVGLLAQRKHLSWVGDVSDPLSFAPGRETYPQWRNQVDARLEQLCLERMNLFIVPTEEIREAYLYHFPRLKGSRIELVPYGYAEEDYISSVPEQPSDFCLVHTGAFYPDIRNPQAFFDALTFLRDLPIRVILVGVVAPQFKTYVENQGLSSKVEYAGFCERKQVVVLQKQATMLILLGNKGGLQLPGKLFEYIAAKRPVLMIRNDPHDIAAQIVSDIQRGVVADNEADQIANAIRMCYEWWKAGNLESQFSLGPRPEFSWRAQAQKFSIALESAATQAPLES